MFKTYTRVLLYITVILNLGRLTCRVIWSPRGGGLGPSGVAVMWPSEMKMTRGATR